MALEKGLEEAGFKKEDLNVIMSLGNTEAIKKGVSSGAGVSIVPEIYSFTENMQNYLTKKLSLCKGYRNYFSQTCFL